MTLVHNCAAEIRSLARRPTPNPRIEDQLTIIEAVAHVAGLPQSEAPTCTNPDLAAFLTNWASDLDDATRDALLLPLVPELIGAHRGPRETFAQLALCWLLRDAVPSWLGAAGFDADARHFANELPAPLTPSALGAWHSDLDARAPAVGEFGGFHLGAARNAAGEAIAAHVLRTQRSTGEGAAADLIKDAFGEGSAEDRVAREALNLLQLAMARSALSSVAAACGERSRDPARVAVLLHDALAGRRRESVLRLVRRMFAPRISA
jgi:hypothetical protein